MKRIKTAILFVLLLIVVGLATACSHTLSTPENIIVEDFVLKFDKVKNADRYSIKIAGDNFNRQFTTTSNDNDISPMPQGNFQISVTAYDADYDIYSQTAKLSLAVSQTQSKMSLADKTKLPDYNKVTVDWKADILPGYTLTDAFVFEDMLYYTVHSADGVKTLCNIEGKSISNGQNFDTSFLQHNILKVDNSKYYTLDGRLRYSVNKEETVSVVGYNSICISTYDEKNGTTNTVLNIVTGETSTVQSDKVRVINNYVVDRRVGLAGDSMRLHVFPFGGNGNTDIGVFSDEISLSFDLDLDIVGDKLFYICSMSGKLLENFDYYMGDNNNLIKVKSYVGSVDVNNGTKRTLNHFLTPNSMLEKTGRYIVFSVVNPDENKFVDNKSLKSFGYAVYDYNLNLIMSIDYSQPFFYMRNDEYSMGFQMSQSQHDGRFNYHEIVGDVECNSVYSVNMTHDDSYSRIHMSQIAFEYKRSKDAAVFDVRDVKTNKLIDGRTLKATDKIMIGYTVTLKVDEHNSATLLTFDNRITETPVRDYHFASMPYVYVYKENGNFGLKSFGGEIVARASENVPDKYNVIVQEDARSYIVYNDSIYMLNLV